MSEPTQEPAAVPGVEERLAAVEKVLGMQRLAADESEFEEVDGSSHQSNNCCNHGGSHASIGCGHLAEARTLPTE